jgi:hypothetical protein
VSLSVSGEKCSNCHHARAETSVTIRMYLKRSQFDYRYRVCPECVRVMKSLLWAGAVNCQNGMFDPPEKTEDPRNGPVRVTRVRA